ncbi:hypothetical protein DPMN_171630 [Dreissena polymorpha]|uniref:Uncharacterized protein n=1 Tax=Dreissena polymorpha TaxID=45954 RepID=A0A9D4IDX2_DREPO|nr:hypothetical protein DPMN_171630 [Dreissena polymorpha]
MPDGGYPQCSSFQIPTHTDLLTYFVTGKQTNRLTGVRKDVSGRRLTIIYDRQPN